LDRHARAAFVDGDGCVLLHDDSTRVLKERCRWDERKLVIWRSEKEGTIEYGTRIAGIGTNGIVNGDKEYTIRTCRTRNVLCTPVWECPFDVNLMQLVRDARKDVAITQKGLDVLHEL